MHAWTPTENLAGSHFVCRLCGVGMFGSLSGAFYTKGNAILAWEPMCLIDVEELITRATLEEAWRVDEGGGKL
jgi:hypothetical protein